MRDRLLRDGYLIVAIAFIGLRVALVPPWDQSVDAYAYWMTRTGDWYASSVGDLGAFLYSPAFAQALIPLVWLPWAAFLGLWTAILMAAHWWMTGRWALPLLLFIPISFEIVSGNIHLLIALAIVVGFRYPAAWAFILLTKVTPGVGLLWFGVRREWRQLAIALGATTAILAVSYAADPSAWSAWIDSLRADASAPLVTPGWYLPVPLLVRLPVAAIIVAWGGVTDRRWTVPVAATLALPVLWLNGLAVLDAMVPLLILERARPRGLGWRPPALGWLGRTA